MNKSTLYFLALTTALYSCSEKYPYGTKIIELHTDKSRGDSTIRVVNPNPGTSEYSTVKYINRTTLGIKRIRPSENIVDKIKTVNRENGLLFPDKTTYTREDASNNPKLDTLFLTADDMWKFYVGIIKRENKEREESRKRAIDADIESVIDAIKK